MAMEEEQPKMRVLMFSWLAHGHITPFLQLSKKLSATNHFTIHFCSTSVNLNSIKQHLSEHDDDDDDGDASINLVELQMPSTPELPPHLHTTRNLPPHLLPALLQAYQESSSSFSLICDSVKPHLLIYDAFQPWAPKIASSKGIPSVFFSTSGATAFSFFHHVYTHGSSAAFPFPAIHMPQHELDRIRNRIRPGIKHDDDDDDDASGVLDGSTEIVLVKSSKHVEEKYLDHLSASCKKEILCTGPLINKDDHDDDEGFEIMKWLSDKNHCSTIYISFGSECFPSKDQIAEIAKGLHLSDANFLWVIRFPDTDIKIEDELPEGFLDTVKERGLVIPNWAPQTKILSHPSIGGFVSHCGWSSVMESMYYGVPVVAMPMKADQPLNAQLVAEAGVGVEVVRDGDCNGMYVGEEVAKAINKVMVEEEVSEGLRNAARRLSEKMREREEEEVAEVAERLLKISIKSKKQE